MCIRDSHFEDQPMATVSPRRLNRDKKPVRHYVKNMCAITAENLDISVDTVNRNGIIKKLIIKKTCKVGRPETLCLPQRQQNR